MSAILLGDTNARETWELTLEKSKSQTSTATTYRGTFAILKAMYDAYTRAGLDKNTVRLEKLRGGLGKLVYTQIDASTPDEGSETEKTLKEWDELESAEVDVPILSLDEYSGYVSQIQQWRDSVPSARSQFQIQLSETDTPVSLTGDALDAARFEASGITTKRCYVPVSRHYRITNKKPSVYAVGCGVVGTPSLVPSSGTWHWLKTGDTIVQGQDTWTRTQEWLGSATIWPAALYGAE